MQGGDVSIDRVSGLIRELYPLARKHDVGPDDSLFAGGILDSLGVLDLVAALEQEFGIAVADDDLVPENFKSISGIVGFVRSKL